MRSPKSFRLHIALFGRRNVGKSSILNALTDQQVSIVSEVAGTTTDPVEKPMELLPLGPVLFIDTAGIDDTGKLGELRVSKTFQVFDRTELGILVTTFEAWGPYEETIMEELRRRNIPFVVVFNKTDLHPEDIDITAQLDSVQIAYTLTRAHERAGIDALRQLLLKSAPSDFINRSSILSDLTGPGEMAVLVVPIDKEAPKGRLILPQVQSIRDLLDGDAFCVVVKEHQLSEALSRLSTPPKLVVTDSQAFKQVGEITPLNIPLTSFSILFARFQADLTEMVMGAAAIDSLKPGDKILIAEACTHHPIEEDIGTVKLPAWLNQYVGGELDIENMRGRDFPGNLTDYKLIVHCGACMWNRREMLSRIMHARNAGVPITNYGLAIAFTLGIFERALEPFPETLAIYQNRKR